MSKEPADCFSRVLKFLALFASKSAESTTAKRIHNNSSRVKSTHECSYEILPPFSRQNDSFAQHKNSLRRKRLVPLRKEGQFIIFISRGNLQNIPALSKLQQTAVQATETGQMMFERWITASLLLREERVLLPPLL